MRVIYFILIMYALQVSKAHADEYIAYLQQTDGYWQVWMMEANGESPKQLSDSQWDKSRISWFPNNKRILANGSQGQVTVINVDSKTETRLEMPVNGAVDAVVSPDGSSIVFSLSVADSIDNNHIWLMDIESRDLRKLTNLDGLQHEPVWSLDSTSIYFLSGKGDQNHDIWRLDLETRSIEQITVNSLYNFDLAVADTGVIAFSSNRNTGDYEIWMLEGGEYHQITQHAGLDARPSFSPDGDRIAFESYRQGSMNIWLHSIGDGAVTRLTQTADGARHPVFSY